MRIILKPLGAFSILSGVALLIGVVVVDKMEKNAKPTGNDVQHESRLVAISPASNKSAATTPTAPAASASEAVLPTAAESPVDWTYTTEAPSDNWMKPGYRTDSSRETWKVGPGGFGNDQQATIGTKWQTPDIWMRTEVFIPANWHGSDTLRVFHDEEAEVYVNGILAAKLPEYSSTYAPVKMNAVAFASLKPGKKNLIAVHCHNGVGGQFVDLGF